MARSMRSQVKSNNPVDILNGHDPSAAAATPISKKRKRGTVHDDATITAGTATTSAAPSSSRLQRPTKIRNSSAAAAAKADRDPFNTMPTSPRDAQPPQRTKRKVKKLGGANSKRPLNPEDSGFGYEQEEGNPLMTSPASNTRSRGKTGQQVQLERERGVPTIATQPTSPSKRRRGRPTGVANAQVRQEPVSESVGDGRREVVETVETPERDNEEQDLAEPEDIFRESRHELGNGVDAAERGIGSGDEEFAESDAETADTGTTEEQKKLYRDAIQFYNCGHYWSTMVKTARNHLKHAKQLRSDVNVQFDKLNKKLRAAYTEVSEAGANVPERVQMKIEHYLEDMKALTVKSWATPLQKEDRPVIKELYLSTIPGAVLLLRHILICRFKHRDFSKRMLRELVAVADIGKRLCEKAFHWRPRPTTLPDRTLLSTKNVVGVSLSALIRIYNNPPIQVDEDEEGQRKEAKRKRWMAQAAEYEAGLEARAQRKLQNQAYTSARRSGERSETGPFDLSDLDLPMSTTTTPNAVRRTNTGYGGTGVNAARYTMSGALPAEETSRRRTREATEEIPPPVIPEWSKQELDLLQRALEYYTGPDRYYKISDTWCVPGGLLEGRDLDDLMHGAKYLKEVSLDYIERQLQEGDERRHWEWLLSVE